MKFYVDGSGLPWRDMSNGEHLIMSRDENSWYIVYLSSWPICKLKRQSNICDHVRDSWVKDGSWMEVVLPEDVTCV